MWTMDGLIFPNVQPRTRIRFSESECAPSQLRNQSVVALVRQLRVLVRRRSLRCFWLLHSEGCINHRTLLATTWTLTCWHVCRPWPAQSCRKIPENSGDGWLLADGSCVIRIDTTSGYHIFQQDEHTIAYRSRRSQLAAACCCFFFLICNLHKPRAFWSIRCRWFEDGYACDMIEYERITDWDVAITIGESQ